jgi:hypothetical protein
MSRIILTKHDNGEDHVVVGYDRPLQTYYWQEFAPEPDWPEDDERWDGWDEMLGFAGYDMGELPQVADLFDHAMKNNERVAAALADFADQGSLLPMLREHKQLPYPASNTVVDMTTREDS